MPHVFHGINFDKEGNMSKDVLDQFGASLMEWVRDWSIEELDGTVSGNGKSPEQKTLGNQFKTLPSGTQEALEKLIPIAVDTTLHYFLWLFEENKHYDIVVKTPDGNQSGSASYQPLYYTTWLYKNDTVAVYSYVAVGGDFPTINAQMGNAAVRLEDRL